MSKVYLQFPPSTSPDVVEYKLFVEVAPNPVTIESPYISLGLNTRVCLNDVIPDVDGVYNLGVGAVDEAGNISPLSIKEGVALDFLAPSVPGPLEIIYEG